MRWGRIPCVPTFDPPIDHLSFATKRKMKKNRLHDQSLIPHKATLQEFSPKSILVCLSWLSPLHVSKWPNTKCHYQLLPFGMENHRKMHSFTMWSFAVFFSDRLTTRRCRTLVTFTRCIQTWLTAGSVCMMWSNTSEIITGISKTTQNLAVSWWLHR